MTVSDALGRLKQVIEDPLEPGVQDPTRLNFITNYTYDILCNLRKVEQGQQHRYYMYDSLSRLIRSRNPEQETNPDLSLNDPDSPDGQWSTSIGYFDNGDISARTDARGIKIEYSYDNLNRLYQRTYTTTRALPAGTYAPTPTVNYYYDGRGLSSLPARSSGKLTRVGSSVSEMRYTGFDEMGRVMSSEQIIDGQTYQMPTYSYNLAGSLVSQIYPSGRTVQNGYDDGGKLSNVSGQAANQVWKTYASDFDFNYTNDGAVSQIRLGNGRWESLAYNKRLQPILVGLGTTQNGTQLMKLEYGYGTTDNNGNIKTQTITVPSAGTSSGFTAVQTYGYDNLNRLNSATETSSGPSGWQQSFRYDRFGNRAVVTAQNAVGTEVPTTPALVGDNPSISVDTDRITQRTGELYQYDAAGNLTADRYGNAYSFDGENSQAAFTYSWANQAAGQYFYDGDRRRVKKIVGNETTVFVYNAFDQMVAEYATNQQPGTNPTTFVTTDNLGTPRVSTDAAGNVLARHDYLPYGEELSNYSGRASHSEYRADSIRQRYTGLERDQENGLDYAQARYYASIAGRFTSVDPLMASASTINPQSFNRYTYALNNPYKYVDPSGLDPSGLDDETDKAFQQLGELVDIAEAERQAQKDADKEAAKKQQQQQAQQQTQPQQQQTSPQNAQQGQAPQQQPNGTEETGTASPTYNCAAWALGYTDRWIQPGSDYGTMGKGVTMTYNKGTDNATTEVKPLTENSLINPGSLPFYFGGKKSSESAAAKPDQYKLIVIEDKKNPTFWHVMRQDPSTGTWSSKNGDGSRYKGISDPVTFYKQKYPDQKHPNQERDLHITYYVMPIKLIQPKQK